MSIITTIDRLNFAAILDLFGSAKERVIIVTHSFETWRNTPLWRALTSIRPEVKLTIVACIPECAMNFQRTIEGQSASKIDRYYSALDPKNFSCLEKCKSITLKLTEDSREPGTCVNFSVVTAPSDDLRFEADKNTNFTILNSGRTATINSPVNQATAELSCFDWGAYGTIEVEAVSESGAHLTGRLKT